MTRTAASTIAEIATRPGSVAHRAQALLDELGRHIPFDASWMALAEPGGASYVPLASTSLDATSLSYLNGPGMAHDIKMTGADRARPPQSLSDLPYSIGDLQTWAECLLPAGFHEALSVALFVESGRHVGFMTVLFHEAAPPPPAFRRQLARVLSDVASAIDPLRSLAASSVFVGGAVAGAVLLPDSGVAGLPGLPDDDLLTGDSEVVAIARRLLADSRDYATFLWPRGRRSDPDGYIRVTVLGGERSLVSVVGGMVVLSPAGNLEGLTPRELEVLGLVIEGCSNMEIARDLNVAPRTVAAHVEHILVKLNAGSRTLAAVRAERAGLYFPAPTITRPVGS